MLIVILGVETFDSMEAGLKKAFQSEGHDARIFTAQRFYRESGSLERASFLFRRACEIASRVTTGSDHGYLQKKIVRALRAMRPDVCIVLDFTLLLPTTVEEIKQATGCIVVGWFPDAIVNLGGAQFLFAPYDMIFFKDPYMVRRLGTELGLPQVRYLPEAFDETLLDLEPWGDVVEPFDVLVYGNIYASRVKHLETLDPSLSVHVFGPKRRFPWRSTALDRWYRGESLRNARKVAFVRRARVCINHGHFGEVESVNARVWEIAGLGGFQLTNLEGVRRFFSDLIPVYSNPEDMNELVHRYLDDEEERAVRAASAQRIVLEKHTWRHRVREMLALVRIDQPGKIQAGHPS
ncbi:MAG: glycosyltransferase [Bacteroidota bacterium]|nr:glycosyltransferase [Bacteroidota bacterium]